MFKSNVIVAPFLEHPIVDTSCVEAKEFDIVALENTPSNFIVQGKFNLEQYCNCLLTKIVSLNKSKIKPFIRYQCEQLVDPFVWLNKLEKLIDLNREHFTTKDQNIKIEKTLVVIELLRQEIESNKFTGSKYNFKAVKQKLQAYKSPEEKLSYLLEVKTEYLQYKPGVTNANEVPFDLQCDLEINLLKSQRKLYKSIALSESRLKKSTIRSKFKINSNVNQFVDIFFQLMHEKQINGKPYLEASPNDLAELIAESFQDKEGKEISVSTVKTILKPSRFEKRPKGNARFEIN